MPHLRGAPRRIALILMAPTLLVGGAAAAGPVQGKLKHAQGYASGAYRYDVPVFWPQLRNTILPLRPARHDIRRQMVVAIDGGGIKSELGHKALVVMRDGAFDPPVLAIHPNTRVTFRNSDSSLHLLEPEKGSFLKAESIPPGDSMEHTFTKAGTYKIVCSELPHMKLTVLVSTKAQLALPANDGSFRFPSLAPGTYTLEVWFRSKWIHRQAITVRRKKTHLEIPLPPIKD